MCNPSLCHDRHEGEKRCGSCPLDKLDAAQLSRNGLIIRRAIDYLDAAEFGVRFSPGEIPINVFHAMRIITEERQAFEREGMNNNGR
ncbi:MAG: hypothetical protein ABFD89_00815 [Bryobacteraceae bacterium]